MNKETGLSAIYAKNITPLVKGDEVKWYRNGTWVTATVKNEKVNTIYPGQLHTNKGIFSDVELSEYGVFVISFADRPNTTGKQPVDGEVVVDCITYNAVITRQIVNQAGTLVWNDECNAVIKSWKPNHAAMLAKFKEQGANTMNNFTKENTKEATHIYSNTQFLKIKNGKYEFINSATNFEWEDGGAAEETHFGAMELSRPVGERKEDHTIDGVTTYALHPSGQYDDQETELATHYSGINNGFYIQGPRHDSFAMVLDDFGQWIYSDCTTNAELDGGEFWKLDGNQVLSEDWAIDHLTDKPTLEQQEKAGVEIGCCTNPKDFGIKPEDFGATPDKPVFTQEAADNNEMPPAEQYTINNISIKQIFTQKMLEDGVRPPAGCLAIHIDEMNEVDILYSSLSFIIFKGEDGKEWNGGQDSFLPIDIRSDEEKLHDAVWESAELRARDGAAGVVSRLLSSDKFTITLNKE